MKSVNVRGNVTSISTIMLREKVEFPLGGFFSMAPKTVLPVSNFYKILLICLGIYDKLILGSWQFNSNWRATYATGCIRRCTFTKYANFYNILCIVFLC